MGYLTGVILLVAGITAVAEKNILKPLSEKEYLALIKGFDRANEANILPTAQSLPTVSRRRPVRFIPVPT